jgi:diguanylate cyclase (GGDEF)-like protein
MPHGEPLSDTTLPALLKILAGEHGATGIALLAAEPSEGQLVATESAPAGLAGKGFPTTERIASLAGSGVVDTGGLLLPTILTRWLGARPAFLCLHPLRLPGFEGCLLLCWPDRQPDRESLRQSLQSIAGILAGHIERHRLENENRRLARRLDSILNHVGLGIAIAEEQGRALVNPVAARLLGLPPGPVAPAALASALRDLRGSCDIRSSIESGDTAASESAEYWMVPATATDKFRVIRSEGHAIGDNGGGRIWLFTDVTALWESGERLKRLNAELLASRASIEEQAQQAIELAEELHQQKQELEESKRESDYLANHDPLTGLNNRRAFRHALQQMMDIARGTRGQVAILFVDLDRFKAVNDTLGHDAGDQLLKQVAQVLTEALRDTDLLARFGGDEFAIATRVPAQGDFAKVAALGERIRQKLQIAVPAPTADNPGAAIDVCGTIGIALYPDDADTIDELFICADQAMYAGKKSGRNRVVLFRALLPG